MKNLIKLFVLIVILAIFTFSKNTSIIKVRDFTLKYGKKAYDFSIDLLKSNENEKIVKTADFLE
jgi:hypothetical protein